MNASYDNQRNYEQFSFNWLIATVQRRGNKLILLKWHMICVGIIKTL
jgi:hypothetical protein